MDQMGKIKPVERSRHVDVGQDHPHIIPHVKPYESLIGPARLNPA
jgi:hypothetical protein